MELVVFDLDGTLLNSAQTLSAYTRETLELLSDRDIAYTIATGRTLHAARPCLADHHIPLPHVYKNGVVIWDPEHRLYRHGNFLTGDEIASVLRAFAEQDTTPFVCTLEPDNSPAIYHPPIPDELGHYLQGVLVKSQNVPHYPLSGMSTRSRITNISALGSETAVRAILTHLDQQDHLVAYAGESMYDPGVNWVDIHHSAASKGSALTLLREELGLERIICFGDSENDASMFRLADECYAPDNARPEIKKLATSVIGHHDQDGIARFLRERFDL